MAKEAKLSIVNYGFNIRSKMDPEAKKEDDAIIQAAKSIVDKHNFGKGAIMVTEAYHTDLGNGNNYLYPGDNMQNLIKSFYNPFNTPFLCFHNDVSKPIGTNMTARYIKKPVQLSRGIASGYGKIGTFIPESSTFEEEPVIDLIQQRRFMAVSIGSKTHRDNMKCSICDKSIWDMECDHIPGKSYEGQKCLIKMVNPIFTECSMAGGNPADIDAMTRRMDCFDTVEDKSSIESITDMISDPWSVAIYDNAITSQFPGADIKGTKDKEESGEEEMPKSIADLVTSYEKRIADTETDKEVLVTALTSANNKIADLQSQIKEIRKEEPAKDQGSAGDETNTDKENETSGEESQENEDTSHEDIKDESAGSDTEPVKDTAGKEDEPEKPSGEEKQASSDEGADSQPPAGEEKQENSSEEPGTESPEKKSKADLLKDMRSKRLKALSSRNTQVISKTYRV